MWCLKYIYIYFFLTLLYIQTSDNTSSFVLNMKPILTLQSTVNTLVANRLDVCSDVVYDWGKCKRSNVSHVCAGRLRVMLVARLGNVKKGDIGTHTHRHSPHSLSPPQALHSSVGFSAPCDWRLCAPHTRCTWLLDGNTLWQDTTDPSAATQRQEERQHDSLQDRSLNAPETLNTQVMLSVIKSTFCT